MTLIRINNFLRKLRNHHFAIFDLFVFILSPFIALFIRSEGIAVIADYFPGLIYFVLISAIVKINLYLIFGLYSILWSAASIDEFAKLVFSNILSTVFLFLLISFFLFFDIPVLISFPFSIVLIDAAITVSLVSFSRFSIRLIERANQRERQKTSTIKIGIVGAGQGGIITSRELQRQNNIGKVVVFIDDDPMKHNLNIMGISVEGPIGKLSDIIRFHSLDKVIIAMPSAPGHIVRKISNMCLEENVEVLTVPSLNEIIDGKISYQQLRKVQVEDLLRREAIDTDIIKVQEFIKGKKILITGAGGSIGSELCRQILSFAPETLILLGHGENSIFEIEHELNYAIGVRNIKSTTKIISKIADIRFKDSLSDVFKKTNPDIIFHAAAHKHVPLMENNPIEAIFNNILGTKNLIELSLEHNISGFVLISTDKAVNPTNIMGTTKRISEIITLKAAKKYKKQFSAVRFGNVLGSRGSVLHTFRKQALTGGPITITHHDITRYFMTIPEAVQLVLQASVLSYGGEVFVLDMGEPIKVLDLARDFIRLSGLKEGIDINIEFCGLRPGEKLYEELFVKGENYIKTKHEKILIASNASNILNDNMEEKIEKLIQEAGNYDLETLYYIIKSIVPEFDSTFSFKEFSR